MTVRNSVTRRVHWVCTDQAVRRLSDVAMKVKEGLSPAEESYIWDVETLQRTALFTWCLSTPPKKQTKFVSNDVDKSPKVYTQLAREGVVLTQD